MKKLCSNGEWNVMDAGDRWVLQSLRDEGLTREQLKADNPNFAIALVAKWGYEMIEGVPEEALLVKPVKKSLMLVMKAKQPNPRSVAEQRKAGIKIEMEHTDDPKEADKIHRDHRKEFKDYYTRLVAMEDQAKKDRKRPQIELDLMEWLNKHPNPEDGAIHALAREWKVNKHQLEEAIYRLATERAAFTKSKAYPIGTVRNWKGVAYEKKGKGDWRPVKPGIKRGAGDVGFQGKPDAFSSLPIETQEDIANMLKIKFPRFGDTTLFWNDTDITDFIRETPDIKIKVGHANPEKLFVQFGESRSVSKKAVDTYREKLRAGVEFDPILISGKDFIDGGHRVVAYMKEGRGKIPAVDISAVLKYDWNSEIEKAYGSVVSSPESKYGGRSDAFSLNVLSQMRKELEKYIPKSALKGMWVWGSKLGAHKSYEFHLPKSETFPDGVYIHVGRAENNADAKVKGLNSLLSRYDGRFDDIKDIVESPEAPYTSQSGWMRPGLQYRFPTAPDAVNTLLKVVTSSGKFVRYVIHNSKTGKIETANKGLYYGLKRGDAEIIGYASDDVMQKIQELKPSTDYYQKVDAYLSAKPESKPESSPFISPEDMQGQGGYSKTKMVIKRHSKKHQW